MAPLSLSTLRKIAKADLHRHFDGSVRLSTIIELAKEQGEWLPSFEEEELAKHVQVDDNCSSLEDYLEGFGIILKVLQRDYAVTRCMYEVCEDAFHDGVTYLEVRFSPILHIEKSLSLAAVMEAALEGVKLAEMQLSITVNLIVCGMRHLPPETTENLAGIAWRYKSDGVVAFDLAGPENGFSSQIHKTAFNVVRSNCLACTLHSGEASGPESIRDSIRHCGANRIGHGVTMREDPDLVRYIVDRKIGIEICLTSNVQTKAIASFDDHPAREYFDQGVHIIPCTDNPTISNTDLSTEYHKLQEHYHFSVEEIVCLADNSFSAAFVSPRVKPLLRLRAIRRTIDVLKKDGYDTSKIESALRKNDLDFPVAGPTTGPFWNKSHVNPPITLEVVRSLPKADLHCRLSTSVPLPFVWEEIQKMPMETKTAFLGKDLAVSVSSFNSLQRFIQGDRKTAKKIYLSTLQTKYQLQKGITSLVEAAKYDGVTYLELMVRPAYHVGHSLKSAREVLEAILETTNDVSIGGDITRPDITVRVILYIRSNLDDPHDALSAAELAIEYSGKGVVGFGMFGPELSDESMSYFKRTFDHLKDHNVRVTIALGQEMEMSNVQKLHFAGATRVSGAFTINKYPQVVQYLAEHQIPIEIMSSSSLEQSSSDLTFSSPIRFFFDQKLVVCVCSFDHIATQSRSEALHEIAQECNLSIDQLMKIMGNGFLHNFSTREERVRMFCKFRKESETILQGLKFRYLDRQYAVPTSQISNLTI